MTSGKVPWATLASSSKRSAARSSTTLRSTSSERSKERPMLSTKCARDMWRWFAGKKMRSEIKYETAFYSKVSEFSWNSFITKWRQFYTLQHVCTNLAEYLIKPDELCCNPRRLLSSCWRRDLRSGVSSCSSKTRGRPCVGAALRKWPRPDRRRAWGQPPWEASLDLQGVWGQVCPVWQIRSQCWDPLGLKKWR